jgi:hypothetical protein
MYSMNTARFSSVVNGLFQFAFSTQNAAMLHACSLVKNPDDKAIVVDTERNCIVWANAAATKAGVIVKG